MVFVVWTHVDHSGDANVFIQKLKAAGEFQGQTIYTTERGSVRVIHEMERVCDSESEAHAEAVRQLTKIRDRLDACIAQEAAKAAGCRVGEAVPA